MNPPYTFTDLFDILDNSSVFRTNYNVTSLNLHTSFSKKRRQKSPLNLTVMGPSQQYPRQGIMIVYRCHAHLPRMVETVDSPNILIYNYGASASEKPIENST